MLELAKVPIPPDDFRGRLNVDSKILFSGIYGSGKTTFLKDFFENDNAYDSVHLYPINYSVAKNEDIFELIKYDILIQLLGKIPFKEFEKIDIPYELTLWSYISNFQDVEIKTDFFASFLNFAGKSGNGFLKVYQQVKALVNKYREYHQGHQEDDLDEIKGYLEKKTAESGHIYEEDFFTELIRRYVSKINNNKKLVLVVDDIDRLDPEHIFRVLNVFSANFDFRGDKNSNKFDFDRVILVADYSNLKNLYTHRYGDGFDFNGYLDKFYDSVYWYSSAKFIKQIIIKFLKERTESSQSIFDSDRHTIGSHITYIFTQFLSFNLISFRDLIRYRDKYNFNQPNVHDAQAFYGTILISQDFVGLKVIRFFLDFFQNDDYFLDLIRKSKKLEIDKGYDRYSSDNVCEMMIISDHRSFKNDEIRMNNKLLLSFNEGRYAAKVVSGYYLVSVRYDEDSNDGKDNIRELSYFEVLEKAVVTYLDLTKRI